MSKLTSIIGAFALSLIVGCDKIVWTPELVYQSTYCVGVTAGAIVQAQQFPEEVTATTWDIINKIQSNIPAEGQTFGLVWTPTIEHYLTGYDKIPEEYKPLILTACSVIITAIDIEVRKYPEFLATEEYARKAVAGLVDGYRVYAAPAQTRSAKYQAPKIDYDLYREVANQVFK
jgi:hypothetical protein